MLEKSRGWQYEGYDGVKVVTIEKKLQGKYRKEEVQQPMDGRAAENSRNVCPQYKLQASRFWEEEECFSESCLQHWVNIMSQ